MIQGALDIQEQTKLLPKENQFVWTLPGWPMTQILNNCTPELKPKIESSIKQGYFAVHALPFTMETESGDVENLARSFIFSSTISRNLGLSLPVDAKMTDVPSHSWFIPTLLTNAGVKILHLGCNPASQSPKVPLLFWWEGPDASRLMTMYWGGDYGTSLIPPDEWKYKTWLAIIHTTDTAFSTSSCQPDAHSTATTMRHSLILLAAQLLWIAAASVPAAAAEHSALQWATYLGGSGNDSQEASIRLDKDNRVFVLPYTLSADAPTTDGAHDRTYNGGADYYLAKLSSDGRQLIYGTYLGGSGDEYLNTHNLAVDRDGNAYISVSTGSTNFPTTPGAYDRTYNGGAAVELLAPTMCSRPYALRAFGGAVFPDQAASGKREVARLTTASIIPPTADPKF